MRSTVRQKWTAHDRKQSSKSSAQQYNKQKGRNKWSGCEMVSWFDMHEDLVKLTMFAETYSLCLMHKFHFGRVFYSRIATSSFSNSELISEFFDHRNAPLLYWLLLSSSCRESNFPKRVTEIALLCGWKSSLSLCHLVFDVT